MRRVLDGFANLPPAAKIGGVVLLCALVGLVILLFGSTSAIYVVLAGVAVVGALLLGYQAVLGAMSRGRAAPMARSISGNAAMAPLGITEPARRARLDDLRRNFESGVEKFRAAGKNLYALPWYLLVGEPGSGKTEAIRHCNVGFPPGLQDQLQGAGGTLNMNWWFTNFAVILDTAGRLMFEEVEPGTSSEWTEFLKLLRKSRPNCPVNGMLLVIPSESLIRDTSEQIEAKAGKIASQLDSIQRTLGVRFPVFVVITKCDLINGFREFFDEIKDPAAQHQMLGWSNPAKLDEPFSPEAIEQHLQSVSARLVRRRTGLLIDPVHSDDPRQRRADQVDALYAFPESLVKIAPRLKRYLEMIFVAGEWSQKPLFLRGIYFTSSMREGSALDAELADALGVSPETLPEGRVWERDRAYFLRDLFMQKVFREKGLVTRAVNTGQHQRMRQMVVYGTLAAGLALVAGMTWLGTRSLKGTIVGPSDFWTKTGKAYIEGAEKANPARGTSEQLLPIVSKTQEGDEDFKYRGGSGEDAAPLAHIPVAPEHRTRGQLPVELKEQANARIGVPWVFYPVAAVTGDSGGNLLEAERPEAARVIFEGSILRPLVESARVRMRADTDNDRPWSAEATGALAQLIRLEAAGIGAAGDKAPAGVRTAQLVDLEPLLKYALKGNDDYSRKGAAADLVAIDGVYRSLYSVSGGTWPPESMRSSNAAAIGRAAEDFTAAWSDPERTSSSGAGLTGVKRAIEAARDLSDAEARLQAVRAAPGKSDSAFREEWVQKLVSVREASARLDALLERLKGRSLRRALTEELERYRDDARRQHELLLKEFESVADAGARKSEGSRVDALMAAKGTIASSMEALSRDSREIADLRAAVDRLDAAVMQDPEHPTYQVRLAAYDAADQRLKAPVVAEVPAPGGLAAALRAIDDAGSAGNKAVESVLAPLGSGTSPDGKEVNDGARAAAGGAVRAAAAAQRAALLRAFLGAEVPGDLGERVSRLAGHGVPRPAVPLGAGEGEFSAKFAPESAALVLGDIYAAARALSAGGGAAGEDLTEKLSKWRQAAASYVRAYCGYWGEGLAADVKPRKWSDWAELSSALATVGRADAVNSGLEKVQRAAESASGAISAVVKPDVAEKAEAEAVAQLASRVAHAGETIRSGTFLASCDRALAGWKSLGADGAGASRALASRLGAPGSAADFLVVFTPAAGEPDFVQRFWRDLTVGSLSTLGAEAGRQAATAMADVRARAKFPVVAFTTPDAELSAEDCAVLLGAVKLLKPGSGPAPGPEWTADAEAGAAVNQLLSGARLSGEDAALVEQAGRWASALPGAGEQMSCRITVLKSRAPKPGNDAVNAYIPYLTLAPQGGQAGQVVGLFGSGEAELASVRMPGAPLELRLMESDAASSKVLATVGVPSRWSGLYLIERFGGRPAGPGGRKTWEVEVETQVQGKPMSLWLKLDFDRELPDLPWHGR